MATHTLQDLFNMYLADADLKPRMRYQYTGFSARVVADLGPLPLDEVTSELLRSWKLHLTQCYKPGTVHQYLRRLHALFNFGVELGWVTTNPLQNIRKPSPGQGRVRFLREDERGRLLAACRQSRNPL